MPSEQVTHYREAKPAAGQYSAAVTLYFLLTGQYALEFETTETARMIQIATEQRIPIRQRRADLSAALEAVIQKALALDVKKRYAGVTALR